MKNFYSLHKKEIDQLLVFIAAIVAISLLFKYCFGLFAPFLLAFALSLIISVPVDFLSQKMRVPRSFSTLLSMVVVLTVLWLALSKLAGVLGGQLIAFTHSLPPALDKAVETLERFRGSYESLFEFFPENMRVLIEQAVLNLASSITSWLGSYASTLSVSTVRAIPKALMFTIVTIVSTFFMTKDKQRITAFFARQAPKSVKRTFEILKNNMFRALWGYIRAQLILMSFSGCIAVIGLTVLGYEYSLLIGLSIALLDALPVFGAGFVLWPWAAFSLISGEYYLAIGLMVIYLAIMLFRQMVEPKILSSQIGLHPLVTLFALYVGLQVFGPIGLIAGPVLAIVVVSLQNAGLLHGWK